MATPTTTDGTTEAQRNAHLWAIVLERLQDGDDGDAQLEALRTMAQLDDAELPIAEITEVVLTPTGDEDGTLYFSDTDDVWNEGIVVLQQAPERIPLDTVVDALTLAFAHDTDSSQMLDFIAEFAGTIAITPFVALLIDAEPQKRQAGLEALYRLDELTPTLPLLTDPDPDTRALAVENVWLLKGMTREQLHQIASDPAQPQVARDMASHYLEKTPTNANV